MLTLKQLSYVFIEDLFGVKEIRFIQWRLSREKQDGGPSPKNDSTKKVGLQYLFFSLYEVNT